MCKVTQEHLDDIEFIYDNFNPFCSQSVDPPPKKEESIPPDSGDKHPEEPDIDARRGKDLLENAGNVIFCSYFLVVVVFLVTAAVSV